MSSHTTSDEATFRVLPTMIRHWTTLAALVEELRPQLREAMLCECFLTEQGELGVHIENATGYLQLTFAPSAPIGSLYVQRSNPPRARQQLFSMLAHSPIEDIVIAEANRVVTLTVGSWEIVFVVIPGAQTNCVVRQRDSHAVVAALRRQPQLEQGMPWDPPASNLPDPMHCCDTMSLGEVLQRSRLLLAAPYAECFCHDHGLDINRLWGTFAVPARESIVQKAVGYRDQLVYSPMPVIARREGTELLLLHAPVGQGWEVEPVPSVEVGVRRHVRSLYRTFALNTARRMLSRHLATELERIQRAIQQLSDDIARAPEADQFERWGQLLVAHPQRHERGFDRITVQGWDGTELDIVLDPALTILNNAERYFTRARKLRRGAELALSRIELLGQRRQVLQSALEVLPTLSAVEQIHALEQTLYPSAGQKKVASSERSQTRARVRQFPLPGGYVLLVGKDAHSNDELTFRIAKPHDIWLHVRGCEGAHGLIPLPSKTLPPEHVIEEAAAIVAYYSAARAARYVPVSWTQRKYLRRPKKGGVGMVDLLRESVVFVEPRLPFNASEAES